MEILNHEPCVNLIVFRKNKNATFEAADQQTSNLTFFSGGNMTPLAIHGNYFAGKRIIKDCLCLYLLLVFS
jgi:hypothetical protein